MTDWPSGPSTIHSVGTAAAAPTLCWARRPQNQGDDDDAGEQRQPEHRVAAVDQGLLGLDRGEVGDEQRPGAGGHHRRDDRHEPAAERAVGLVLVLGEGEVGHDRGS